MRKIIKNKKKGILFWVTGLSGSGKTTLSKKIKKDITNLYGPTIVVSGDDLRKIFNLNKYEYKDRLLVSYKFSKFAKFITDQKINLIFAAVGMIHSLRNRLKKNIKNYLEIYIKSDIKKIIQFKKKKVYHRKNTGALVGISIKPEFPKNPNIIINNNFKKSSDELAKILIKKIKDIV
ncbi:adenylyl-sulfate kinase [Candidatus Pelagibacter sp. Uisw_092]|uniref:adenylyl-sulfate kinase n=1 Tax=Candidatus Pelagibacter sp. Uisw_092 TaxID=3230979 RepID=UPI0039E92FD2